MDLPIHTEQQPWKTFEPVLSMDERASKLQNLLQHTDTEIEPDSELTEQAMSVSVIAPVLHVLNELRQRHLPKDYAIVGGIAVLYYKEMETIQR